MMRQIVFGLGRNGYELRIESAPAWAMLLERTVDAICPLLGHSLCHPYEWMFKLGWGRDEDGYGTRSLGSLLWAIGQGVTQIRHDRTVREWGQSLSVEQMKRYFPNDRMFDYEDLIEPQRVVIGPTQITASNGFPVHYTATA